MSNVRQHLKELEFHISDKKRLVREIQAQIDALEEQRIKLGLAIDRDEMEQPQ